MKRKLNRTQWIGGLVGPRANLDAVEKRNISCPCLELNPNASDVQ
jgi:hypothetical protein